MWTKGESPPEGRRVAVWQEVASPRAETPSYWHIWSGPGHTLSLRSSNANGPNSNRPVKRGREATLGEWSRRQADGVALDEDELTCGSGQHPYPPAVFWQHVSLSSHMPPSGQTSAVLRPSSATNISTICRVCGGEEGPFSHWWKPHLVFTISSDQTITVQLHN